MVATRQLHQRTRGRAVLPERTVCPPCQPRTPNPASPCTSVLQMYTYIAFPSETVTRSGYQARAIVLLQGGWSRHSALWPGPLMIASRCCLLWSLPSCGVWADCLTRS